MTDRYSASAGAGRHGLQDADTQSFTATDSAASTARISAVTAETPPPPIIIRRARPSAFVPPQPADGGQLISRDAGVQRKPAEPKIPRNRKIAGNLPSWDPVPPGEIHVVHRGSRSVPQ